ncbi:MAG: restriction endonuclease subunit S [Proteobacteria bacterium]|nr:restriction endonuclease subunit S [Pseudomonadota bacterium]
MKEELPRYPAYQKSRISWANLIPVGWETGWLGECSSSIQTGPFGSQLHASDYINEGIPVINPSNIAKGKVVADWDNTVTESKAMALSRHRFQLGDIVFGRRGEMGRCAAIGQDEIGWLCGTGSLLVRLKQNRLLPDFAVLLLSQESVRDMLILESVGATMDNLNTRILAKVRIPVPPINEQHVIISFLGRETEKIDRLMDVRRKQIETLQEQRTAVIHHAVTKGIDPQVKMKPSGVEWLGDVPENWEIRPLKYAAELIMGQSPPSADCNLDGNGLPFLQGCAEFGSKNPLPKLFCESAVKRVRKNDILMSVRAPVGDLNVADQEYGIGRGLCAIRGKIIEQEFVFYLLSCGNTYFQSIATGTTYDAVTVAQIGRIIIPIPSSDDRIKIVKYIESETEAFEMLISKYQRELELLAEYRASLISHAVTGKIDVRGLVKS